MHRLGNSTLCKLVEISIPGGVCDECLQDCASVQRDMHDEDSSEQRVKFMSVQSSGEFCSATQSHWEVIGVTPILIPRAKGACGTALIQPENSLLNSFFFTWRHLI